MRNSAALSSHDALFINRYDTKRNGNFSDKMVILIESDDSAITDQTRLLSFE